MFGVNPLKKLGIIGVTHQLINFFNVAALVAVYAWLGITYHFLSSFVPLHVNSV